MVQTDVAEDRRVTLRAGTLSAELAPTCGGRLAMLRVDGASGQWTSSRPGALAVGSAKLAKGGAYPLFPYSNRIRGAVLHHAGRDVALRPHPAAPPHALHGPAHLRPWRLLSSDEANAEIALDYARTRIGLGL